MRIVIYEAQQNMNFDTHKHIKAFKAAGIEEKQAEAIVSVIQNSRDYDLSRLATKEQLELVKVSLSKDIDTINQRIDNIGKTMVTKEDIAKLETMIEKKDASQKAWFIGMFITMVGLFASIFFKLN